MATRVGRCKIWLTSFDNRTPKTPCYTQQSDFAHVGAKTLGRIDPKIFLICPRPNHVFQIWWRSVKGFSVGWGSHFAIPHWLWRSSLQHSHTTVWAFSSVISTVSQKKNKTLCRRKMPVCLSVFHDDRPHCVVNETGSCYYLIDWGMLITNKINRAWRKAVIPLTIRATIPEASRDFSTKSASSACNPLASTCQSVSACQITCARLYQLRRYT